MSFPIVSVGVPTYNRPAGLEHTLQCLVGQTYPHLEIIVADNASPGEATAAVVERFARADPRVTYHRHEQNLGATGNFKFVLKQASGEFFMWAADDDDWDARFVETCLRAVQAEGNAACSQIGALFHRSGQRQELLFTPALHPGLGAFINAREFLRTLRSSLFYGVHRRESLLPMLREDIFDYYDCFLILRQVLTGGVTVAPEILYWAGIDGDSYVLKPYHPAPGRVFDYWPFIRASSMLIWRCRNLCRREKFLLLARLLGSTAHEFHRNERQARPVQARLMGSLLWLSQTARAVGRWGRRPRPAGLNA